MRVIPAVSIMSLNAALTLLGCDGADPSESVGSGGATGPGATTTGGTYSSGGATAAATVPSTSAAGGVTTTQPATAVATGGTTGSVSGTVSPSTGGATVSTTAATGGITASGGAKATGGTTTTSGSKVTGGTTSSGGAKATSGTTSTGGAKAIGGTTSTGGAKATGGGTATSTTPTTGGTGGGATANFKCANLLSAAGATGKAAPSGAAGGLKVLDWAGFKSAISYTFDDATDSQISSYSAMTATGGRFTFYLIVGSSTATNATWTNAVKDNHELANHTSDHVQTYSGSTGTDAAQSALKSKYGVTAFSFAAPYGTVGYKAESVKFLTNRSVSGGSMSAGDIASLAWLPSDIATASNLAPTAGKWRVICIHGFAAPAYQPIDLSAFTTAAKAAISGGSWVDTVTNIAAYQVGQNAISKGSGNTITWTLPAVFPPNTCVRVTTTGGTVKQNGAVVPWDDHGYYEISLDAKSVTVE